MDEKEKSGILQSQWLGFNSNIGALYTFYDNLSETADRLDRERKRDIASRIAPIIGESMDEIEKEISELMPSIDDLDIYPDIRENASTKESLELLQDSEFQNKLREWENKHPHKSHKLTKTLISIYSNPPINGLILRKSMLITLVTFLEVLIESLFRNHFLIQGLSKEEASNKAEKYMSGGWKKRLGNLSEIGIPDSVLSMSRAEILDITNLRNLLVHNDGVVDNDYLKHPLQNYRGKLTLGAILVVSTKRLGDALNIIWTYGFLLCQSYWRQKSNDLKTQNDRLDQFFLNAFDEKRHNLIIELSEKIKVLELAEATNHRILVNRAIAFRELGNLNEVESIVTKLRSTSHDWQIAIAISTLNRDYKSLQRQLVTSP